MRSIAAILACTVMLLGGSAGEEPFALKLVDLYSRIAYLPEQKLRECVVLLKSEIEKVSDATHESLKPVDALMHAHGCLDKYSWLHTTFETGGGALPTGVRMMMVEGVVYIRIDSFEVGTRKLFEEAYAALPQHAVRAAEIVVLDLRHNPGGRVMEMRDILNEYFSPHPMLTFMRARTRPGWDSQQISDKRGVLAGKVFILLVDSETASAAEWLAAVIRFEMHTESSAIVGERTYGKAIIQCLPPDGIHGIKVTCAEWSAAGEKVQGVGLKPDIRVEPFCRHDPACIVGWIFELAKQ